MSLFRPQTFAPTFPLALLFCFLVLASTALGQASRQLSTIERRIETMNRQAADYERENMGRDGKKVDPDSGKRAAQIRAEIQEDLTDLQAAYNAIVQTLKSQGEVNSAFAANSASCIAKIAARLKVNLALPGVPLEKEKSSSEPLPASPRRSLNVLCKHIYAFITNPIFESSARFEVNQAYKASIELDAIIATATALSER